MKEKEKKNSYNKKVYNNNGYLTTMSTMVSLGPLERRKNTLD